MTLSPFHGRYKDYTVPRSITNSLVTVEELTTAYANLGIASYHHPVDATAWWPWRLSPMASVPTPVNCYRLASRPSPWAT